ncbi:MULTISPECIES: ExeM/NucH family extracellular endonuclease [unclassified Brevibacterium]|uniref:ExeM/NucH family extracellular endonuclease n=1 Tax=unclassified Brevibacterium TaxID=2614124 RepID=UPI001E4A33D3|nr:MULTISPECIES: ExeM/NucH family extracellular endonuclease [unclassified Brevibacterium]MCD1287382.1 endonuclease/exonuclease/phosphatase [Brevibacterium sp. CCUG 69071]MDK8436822.1 ExeM/NucH family extracellular endonuclease [Brevibacterium sp. H-BE7]
MKVTPTLSSAAALSLVTALGLAAPATAATISDAADAVRISEIAYTLDTDFIEIAADPGTDVSGWTIGSVTRGGSVQAEENTTTLPENTTVGDSGALAVEVPITNSVKSGNAADGDYGSSAYAIDSEDSLVDFEQIGGTVGGKGVTGTKGKHTPEPVVGQEAEPTGTTASTGQSIQLINGVWKSQAPTPNALPGDDGDDDDNDGDTPDDVTPIAEIQGTGAESPLQGESVRTRGVITAAYPEGGLNGYYIQTPGTGGAEDETPGASDGVFVYSPDTVDEVNIDDHVEVTGTVSERYGQTQMSVSAKNFEVLSEPAEAVKPVEDEFPTDAAEREALEGMLLQPGGELTVADNYNTNTYGEVVLAPGEGTLPQATDVARPGTEEAKAIEAENLEREVVLDDGATVNFLNDDKDVPLPYVSKDEPVRVGATATITSPVVLGFDHEKWRFQPTTRLTGENAEAIQPASFSDTRTEAPEEIGGQVSLASFNVLNYFTTTGDQLEGCQYYDDREGNHITVRGGCDARGAANAESLKRQETKIVTAINKLDTSVVSLMEIENSAAFDEDRDAALATLVERLNQAAGSEKWDFVPSPAEVPADEDVIQGALIYQPAEVAPQEDSTILDDEDAFSNAREPLSQAFAPKDEAGEVEEEKTFVTLSNHFKSKGSGEGPGNEDNGDGQGASNADRVKQAKSLVKFAGEQQKAADSDYVFMLGDFNSYTQEDPMQVFYEAGFKDVAAEKTEKSTYVYQSRTGSLDHVLALDTSGGRSQATGAEADLPTSAFDAITGADVWNINSVESLALEYSRFNYNVADLYAPDQFRASDHDPVVVGLFDDDSDGGDDEGSENAGGSDDADGAEGSADSAGSDDADGVEADADVGDSGSSSAGSGSDADSAGSDGGDSSGSNADSGSSSSDGSSASSDGSSDSEAGGDLPRTGTDLTIMMAIAAGLIAIGATVVLIVRRRRLS